MYFTPRAYTYMADKNVDKMADNVEELAEEFEGETCFLIDEEGNEKPFEIAGRLEIDGVEYLAFMPLDSDDCEYIILKKERDENGEDVYATIDDDEEFEAVAEAFEDEIFAEFDLDDLVGDDE